ncbi:hypothetical protein ASA1KI_21690 [Opitutales bacterium ASA1]|uniref:cyclic nucleotide-binding domain-containing protein n=1 Tax=Congregicoccus parvus TaxID=3081749 RepID=UPI002B316730|nr:hypothetical protein ASA1KI_21690 [Opitutales bacterium ASA1]
MTSARAVGTGGGLHGDRVGVRRDMDLTLESALSPGGLVGHLSYLLLVFSMLMRRIVALRILALGSALVAIVYGAVWLRDPVGTAWECLLAAVNIGQLLALYVGDRRVKFTAEESAFMESRFAELGPRDRRRLLDCGWWRNGCVGEVLAEEGSPVRRLVFVVAGEASVTSEGVEVARCGAGDFVGELTVLTGEEATGTARLETSARYWSADASDLRRLAADVEEVGRALERAFARGLKEKLVRRNRLMVASYRSAGSVD